MKLFKLGNVICAAVAVTLAACHSNENKTDTTVKSQKTVTTTAVKLANAATIMARKEVPILCYHQIRDWTAKDSKSAKDDICPLERFKSQIKMLADSGYHSILPDQLYAYLTTGAALPTKPIMITFDDTDLDQFTMAYPELKKYNYKGLYFIMTVSLGRPRYISREQVKILATDGNVIGSHTWNHHMVTKYKHNTDPTLDDWVTQVDKPSKKLEDLTGKKADYFAYPYGLWNQTALLELKKHGFKAAFQLAEKRDPKEPLFTIRRIIGSGYWSARDLNHAIRKSFK